MIGVRVPLVVPGALAAGTAVSWPGGVAAFSAVSSNWSAATATLEVSGPDGVTQLTVGSSTTVTANAFVTPLYLPAGTYTVALSGGTPTGLNIALDRIPT